MPPRPLINFEIKEYYESEPRFNGVFSRDNLPERSSTETIKSELKLFIQQLVLDNDCCFSRNVGRTKINLVMSNNLYFLIA